MPTTSSPDTAGASRWTVALLATGLVLATVLVVVLALQLRKANADMRWFAERATRPYVGMYVPRVPVASLDGQTHELGQPKADYQLVFFFTTTCPYCRASLPLVKNIARDLPATSGQRAEILGVAFATPAQAQAYAREHALDFPVIALEDRRISMLFRARKVPAFLVIDRNGRVKHSHSGVLNTKHSVKDILAAVRPEAAPPTAAPSTSAPSMAALQGAPE